MYISDIKKDKKHLNKIILSSGDEILIDVDVCIEKGISVNDGIDEDFIKQLKDESEYKRAKFLGRVFQDPMLGTAADMEIQENLALANRRGKNR